MTIISYVNENSPIPHKTYIYNLFLDPEHNDKIIYINITWNIYNSKIYSKAFHT